MDETGSGTEIPIARMVFVDALRGIAAVSVLFHHLVFNSFYQSTLRAVFPSLFTGYCYYGRFGVEVFFVISGFVITHSLIDNPLTARSLGNFILRRQVRLDPPYWTVLVFILAWGWIAVPQFGSPPTGNLSGRVIVANFTYLQRIVDVPVLLVVAWTLCLEIQFYLFLIVLLALSRFLCRGRRSSTVEAVFLLTTGGLSLAYRSLNPLPEGELYTWLPHGWCYFVGGALSYLSVRVPSLNGVFRSFLMLFIAFNVFDEHYARGDTIIGLSAILLLWGVGKAGKLATWLGEGGFQYLGRLSYSLYLVHFPITVTLLNFGYSQFSDAGRWMSVVWFLAAGAVSFLAAHLLHITVERPSIQLATALKRYGPETGQSPVVCAVPSTQ